jgi:hypothetical protein
MSISDSRHSSTTKINLGVKDVKIMNYEDFFESNINDTINSWMTSQSDRKIRFDLVCNLKRGTIPGEDNLATALALTRIAWEEYEAYGTDSSQSISNEESRELLRTLILVLHRQGINLQPPWCDFSSFRSYWIANDGRGSWQARRDMIAQYFGPVRSELEDLEEKTYANELATPVSPRDRLGWTTVDQQIEQLRYRFRTASTTVDYKDVGNRCVGVLEELSRILYQSDMHCAPDEKPPPVDKTNIRIGAYVDRRLKGSNNAELRGLVKKVSALSHKIKHSPTADRTTAGIAADTVIMLANILRRLQETREDMREE